MALMLPPAPLRCTRCEQAATERYGVAFGRDARPTAGRTAFTPTAFR
jgi:hypothetical protein